MPADTTRGLVRRLVHRAVARRRWGHSRARLIGPERLREWGRSPFELLATTAPSAVLSTWRARPDERLIGLLMIRDEDDVLREMLSTAVRWFDRILVLDGTVEHERATRTAEILAAFPEVVHVAHDRDVPVDGPIRDGARQVLLDEARRRYGTGNWIGVLHADEFIDQDPRPMLARHNPLLDPTVRVRLVHTFLHVDDQADWHDDPADWSTRPLRERLRHAMWPGVPETRFFFDRGNRDYRLEHHSKTVPTSFRAGPIEHGFHVVQYNERSPAQALERGRSRDESGWQTEHYARFLGETPTIFADSLDTERSPFAPEFAGDPEGPTRVVVLDDVPAGPIDRAGTTSSSRLDALVERPSRLGVVRWWLRVSRATPATHQAVVDYTARVLASRRTGSDDRRRVADECLAAVPTAR